jgi:predicted RNA-binding protein with PIN domain
MRAIPYRCTNSRTNKTCLFEKFTMQCIHVVFAFVNVTAGQYPERAMREYQSHHQHVLVGIHD